MLYDLVLLVVEDMDPWTLARMRALTVMRALTLTRIVNGSHHCRTLQRFLQSMRWTHCTHDEG